jgi:hypothetical protein
VIENLALYLIVTLEIEQQSKILGLEENYTKPETEV